MTIIEGLTIYQGSTFQFPFTLMASGTTESIDLTGCSARSQLRQNYGTPVLVEFTISSSYASDGKMELDLTKEQTAALTAPSYVLMDVVLMSGATETRICQGKVAISPSVTK